MMPNRSVVRISTPVLLIIVLLLVSLISVNIWFAGGINQTVNSLQSFFLPKPGDCLILPQKYCGKIELKNDPNNEIGLMAVLSVNERVPVFSPIDGSLSVSTFYYGDKTYSGVFIIDTKDGNFINSTDSYSLIYPLKDSEKVRKVVKRGDLIGYATTQEISQIGKNNLIFYISSRIVGTNKMIDFSNNELELKRLFDK